MDFKKVHPVNGHSKDYKFRRTFPNISEFKNWCNHFKSVSTWHSKGRPRNSNGFEYFYCTPDRSSTKTCWYSNSNLCSAKVRVHKDNLIVECDERAREHIELQELNKFVDSWSSFNTPDPSSITNSNAASVHRETADGVSSNVEISDTNEHGQHDTEYNDASFECIILETLKEIDTSEYSDDVLGPSKRTSSSLSTLSVHRETTNVEISNSNPSNSDRFQKEQERKVWDELSKKLMECLQISPRQIPQSRYQPPQIINVSEHNNRIDWGKLGANSNLKMVIARSTVGLELDKEFYYNYRSMSSVKFKQLGVYHQFLGGSNAPSPEEQIQFVVNVLENVDFNKRKDLFVVAVQTEYNANFDPYSFTARLVTFINLVLQNDFMRPIIFCNNNSWETLIDSNVPDELLSKLPLWIARFTDDPSPEYPGTWKSRGIPWWMWQYTGTGIMDGIINHTCFSRRNESYCIQDDLFYSAV